MNEHDPKNVQMPEPSDEQILTGIRARLSGVEPLLPATPAWRSQSAAGRRRSPIRFQTRAYGLGGLAVAVVAVAILAVAVAPLGLRGGPVHAPSASSAQTPVPEEVKLTYSVDPTGGRLPTKAEETQLTDVIAARLQAAGISNFTLAAGASIQLDISGPVDRDSVGYLMGHRGVFEIVALPADQYGNVDASGNQIAGPKALPSVGDATDPTLPALIPDADLLRDQVRTDSSSGTWAVSFALNPDGTDKLATFSSAHVGDYMALVVDGKVVVAPFIKEPITAGQGQFSGDFTSSQAMLLATVLRNGPLAFQLHEVVAPGVASPAPGSATPTSAGASMAAAGYRWQAVDVANLSFDEIYGWSGGYVATSLIPEAGGQYTLGLYASRDGRSWQEGTPPYAWLLSPGSIGSLTPAFITGPSGPALIDLGKPGPVGIWTSSDGLTWKAALDTSAFGKAIVTAVLGDSDGYVAVGGDLAGSSTATKTVWTSSDGAVWRAQPISGAAIAAGGMVTQLLRVTGGYVAAGRVGNQAAAWFSPDLISWTPLDLTNLATGPSSLLHLVAPGPNALVAESIPVGGSSQTRGWAASSSGRDWHAITESHLFFLADGSRAVAFGTVTAGGVVSPAVWTSTDGVVWTQLAIDGVSRPDWGESGPDQAALGPNGGIAVYWQGTIWLIARS